MEEIIKLEGKAKDHYLSNLDTCRLYLQEKAENLNKYSVLSKNITADGYLWLGKTYNFPMQKPDILQNIKGLISILHQKPQVEVSLATGMPAASMLMAIDYAGKNIDDELKELTSKISSGFAEKKDSKLTLENMLISRIKSKIYSFDTPAAESLQAEGKPLHEIIAPEITLRDRKYFLDAVKKNNFSIDSDIPTTAAIVDRKSLNVDDCGYFLNKIYYLLVCDISFTDYDFTQGSFSKSIIRFFVDEKKAKKIFLSPLGDIHEDIAEIPGVLRPKYQKILGNAFKSRNIDLIYKHASDIRYFHPQEVMKLTLKRFYDANTDNASLGLPENFFRDYPDAVVMDVASERIIPSYDVKEYLINKNYHPETKKSKNIFRLYWHEQLDKHLFNSQKLENIKPINIQDI